MTVDFSVRFSVFSFDFEQSQTLQNISSENTFIQGKLKPLLAFNPGLALFGGFRTTGPRGFFFAVLVVYEPIFFVIFSQSTITEHWCLWHATGAEPWLSPGPATRSFPIGAWEIHVWVREQCAGDWGEFQLCWLHFWSGERIVILFFAIKKERKQNTY